MFSLRKKKRDWWFQDDKKNIYGPQAELIEEFILETKGQIFHMYRLPNFLKQIDKYFEIKVKKDTLDHIEKIDYDTDLFKKFVRRGADFPNYPDIVYDDVFDILYRKDLRFKTITLIAAIIEDYGGKASKNILLEQLTNYFNIDYETSEVLLRILTIEGYIVENNDGYFKLTYEGSLN